MKITIKPDTRRDGIRIVRAKAVINKSVKLGIPRRYQKTWTVKTVAPSHVSEQSDNMFTGEAKRWEQKIMEQIKNMSPPERKLPVDLAGFNL